MESPLGDAGGNCGSKPSMFRPAAAGLTVLGPASARRPSRSLASQCEFNKPISKPSRPGASKDLRLLNVKHLIISDYFQ